MTDKIQAATRLIELAANRYRRPAVLWSGGKDSTVLLHLCKSNGRDWPVIFWQQPWCPAKYVWARKLTAAWDLTVYTWPPMKVTVQQRDGLIELVNHYLVSRPSAAQPRTIAVPFDFYEPDPGSPEKLMCGLDWLRQPKGAIEGAWDVFLHGHKSTDKDPMLGPVPIQSDLLQSGQSGVPDILFPLRDWSDRDIWTYTNDYRVPFQEDRYEQGTERLEDRRTNSDYWPVCVRCLDLNAPKSVPCPISQAMVSNLSGLVPRHDPIKPEY